MENGGTCLNDWLEFTFSDKEPSKICGRRPPRRSISGAGPSNVTFVSNESIELRGFMIQYQSKSNSTYDNVSPSLLWSTQNYPITQDTRLLLKINCLI